MVRRIFVEKKPAFAVKAKELKSEMSEYLGIEAEDVRVLIRYDVENVSDETFAKAKGTVFSEPPVDDLYEEEFPHKEGDFCFTVEYLPGQFDQRADSAEQCVCLLNDAEHPIIKSATTYVISGVKSGKWKAASEWQEAVVNLDKMVYNDARKEFDLNSQTGFGADGDRQQAQADFEEVRGSFESNSFVKAVLEHIERKSALGERVLEQLSHVQG
jgi:phosphoribosylformylglycinamidine synthase